MGLSGDLETVCESAKNSNTYNEFKMKMSVCGIDIYKIDVLKVIFASMRGKDMKDGFYNDVRSAIDKECISDYALSIIGKQFSNPWKKQTKFDSFIAKVWIGKNGNKY